MLVVSEGRAVNLQNIDNFWCGLDRIYFEKDKRVVREFVAQYPERDFDYIVDQYKKGEKVCDLDGEG